MGLVIVVVLALYLLISIAVVIGAIRYAKKTGKSTKRWGWGAVLIMYLIPFWDWLPTVAVHQYYCATEAGFWQYKTVDQWKVENPGVMEALTAKTIIVADRRERTGEDNWKSIYFLNDRFEQSFEHKGPMHLHNWRTEATLTDSRSREILVRTVDFYTAQTRAGGGWRGWKFWLAMDHCPGHAESSRNFGTYLAAIKGRSK